MRRRSYPNKNSRLDCSFRQRGLTVLSKFFPNFALQRSVSKRSFKAAKRFSVTNANQTPKIYLGDSLVDESTVFRYDMYARSYMKMCLDNRTVTENFICLNRSRRETNTKTKYLRIACYHVACQENLKRFILLYSRKFSHLAYCNCFLEIQEGRSLMTDMALNVLIETFQDI